MAEARTTMDSASTLSEALPVTSPTVRSSVIMGPLPVRTANSVPEASSPPAAVTSYPTRKLVRRDSLDRREAQKKGNEGSRQRRRWENDRLLSNPWAQPPLPSDWEIRPTYPRRNIPYYLAPLWDAAEFQRAIEAKLSGGSRRGSTARQRNRKHGSLKHPGMSPIEEAASNIPKEVKARLKKSRAAKGLLQDLEEEVRGYVRGWNEVELHGRGSGDGIKRRERAETMTSVGSGAVIMDESDEEDEEIVFVGRKGVVVDADTTMEDASSVAPSAELKNPEEERMTVGDSKMIFEAPEDDKGASFARWLVHCVGSYYGLRTWSVTREVAGSSNKREAYVGIDERARGFMGRCVDVDGRKEVELPRPLWAMV